MPDEITPPPAPAPAPAPAPPLTTPVTKSYKGLSVTSWILIIATGLIAIVPVLGYASALLVWIVAPLVIIFAIIILTRGGTGQGIFLILLAILLVPWSFLAPTVSTLLLGASISSQEQAQEKQIIGNLTTIETAKAQWATETGAASGTAVTLTQLTKYLGGSEIKTVVGETYDPHPVGEAPSAKLPATKSLASHKAGEEITAASATAPAVPASASPAAATAPSPSPSPSASAEEEEE